MSMSDMSSTWRRGTLDVSRIPPGQAPTTKDLTIGPKSAAQGRDMVPLPADKTSLSLSAKIRNLEIPRHAGNIVAALNPKNIAASIINKLVVKYLNLSPPKDGYAAKDRITKGSTGEEKVKKEELRLAKNEMRQLDEARESKDKELTKLNEDVVGIKNQIAKTKRRIQEHKLRKIGASSESKRGYIEDKAIQQYQQTLAQLESELGPAQEKVTQKKEEIATFKEEQKQEYDTTKAKLGLAEAKYTAASAKMAEDEALGNIKREEFEIDRAEPHEIAGELKTLAEYKIAYTRCKSSTAAADQKVVKAEEQLAKVAQERVEISQEEK